jgi:hypothetical protein
MVTSTGREFSVIHIKTATMAKRSKQEPLVKRNGGNEKKLQKKQAEKLLREGKRSDSYLLEMRVMRGPSRELFTVCLCRFEIFGTN